MAVGRSTAWMMATTTTLLVISTTPCYGVDDNWLTEPQQTLRLSIGSESYKIESSKPTTIAIDGQEKKVSVISERYRTFKTDSFSFDYPSTFRYKRAKIEPGDNAIHVCVLDGSYIAVLIAEQTPKLDFQGFAEYLRKKFNKHEEGVLVTEKREEFKTSNSTLDEMTFSTFGTNSEGSFQQTHRCFLIPSHNKETCVILIASLLSVPPSDEARDFITTLGKTLVVTDGK